MFGYEETAQKEAVIGKLNFFAICSSKPAVTDNDNMDTHVTTPGVDFAIKDKTSDYLSNTTLPQQTYTSEEVTLHGKLICSTSKM